MKVRPEYQVTKDTAFGFLGYELDPDFDEKDIKYFPAEVNEHIKKLKPDYFEIKRIVFPSHDGLKVEMNLLNVKVLFLSNTRLVKQNMEDVQSLVKTLQISRHMNPRDICAYFSSIGQRHFKDLSASSSGNLQLIMCDDDAISSKNLSKIFN